MDLTLFAVKVVFRCPGNSCSEQEDLGFLQLDKRTNMGTENRGDPCSAFFVCQVEESQDPNFQRNYNMDRQHTTSMVKVKYHSYILPAGQLTERPFSLPDSARCCDSMWKFSRLI